MFLNPDIEMQLNQKVIEGLYPSKEYALEEAIKLLNQKEAYVKFINNALSEAEEDVIKGNMLSFDEVKYRMEELKNKSLS